MPALHRMRRLLLTTLCPSSAVAAEPVQYIVFNRAPGQGMYQGQPESLGRKAFEEVLAQFPNVPDIHFNINPEVYAPQGSRGHLGLSLRDIRVELLAQ